jgi:hypothetical protein
LHCNKRCPPKKKFEKKSNVIFLLSCNPVGGGDDLEPDAQVIAEETANAAAAAAAPAPSESSVSNTAAAAFLKTIPRLYLSGKFSFVVTARLVTRIEWFLFTKCMLLLLMSLPEST